MADSGCLCFLSGGAGSENEGNTVKGGEMTEEVERLKQLLALHKEYILLLGDEIEELSGVMMVHGWKSTRARKGTILRNKITRLTGVIKMIEVRKEEK